MGLIKDPEVYERFEQVIFVHGVRWERETAVVAHRVEQLRDHEFLGEAVRKQLRYYPIVSRETYPRRGRITNLVESGQLFRDLDVAPFDPALDRVMVCGGPAMLADTQTLLDTRGFTVSPHVGEPGDYVIERAFVAK